MYYHRSESGTGNFLWDEKAAACDAAAACCRLDLEVPKQNKKTDPKICPLIVYLVCNIRWRAQPYRNAGI